MQIACSVLNRPGARVWYLCSMERRLGDESSGVDVPISPIFAHISPTSFCCWVPQPHFEFLVAKGWARLSDANLELIKKYSPNGVVEFGAGSGFVAHLLREKGVSVDAFDLMDDDFKHGGSHTFLWTWKETDWIAGVARGGIECWEESHGTRSLLLVWPKGKLAVEALQKYSGEYLIYVGEHRGGLTADIPFFDQVEDNWVLVDKQEIDNFAEQRGFVFVLKKRPALTPKVSIFHQQTDAFERIQRLAKLCAEYWMGRGFYQNVINHLDDNLKWLKSFDYDYRELEQLQNAARHRLRIPDDENPFQRGDFFDVSSYHPHMPQLCIRCKGSLEEKLLWAAHQLDFCRVLRCYSCMIQCHGIGKWSCFEETQSVDGRKAICWRACNDDGQCDKHNKDR